MAQIEATKADLLRLENLMKILKRGKFELAGEEILSMAQVITWVSTKYTELEEALKEESKPTPKPAPGVSLAPRAIAEGEEDVKIADKPIIRRRRKG